MQLIIGLTTLILVGCGPARPTCEEISQTTYSVDITRLPEDRAVLAREAMVVLARDLSTTINEVPSCAGLNDCYTVYVDPTLPKEMGGRAEPDYTIRLSAYLPRYSDRVTLHIVQHELVHQIRLDQYRPGEHDPADGALMHAVDQGEDPSHISDHDRWYICGQFSE